VKQMKRRVRLTDFVEINPRVDLEKSEEYPCVMMEDIIPGRRYVSPRAKRLHKGGAVFQAGDTLFARITPCLENGKIAQFVGQKGEIGFGSTEFFVFRHREGVSDPGYVFYLALSDFVRKPAEKSMFGASGRQRADLAVVKEVEVPAPPLPTQRKIAAILSAYDDLIENNTRRIALLEEMARRLYREWFVRFRFPGHESVRMVDSPLGKIPEGWEVRTLGDIAQEVRRGVEPDEVEPDTAYVGLEHLPRKSIALSEWGLAQDATSTKLAFREGEILFGKIRPYFHKVVVAPIDGICSTDTIVIVSKTPEYFPLALACVSSEPFVEYASQTSQGTKMPRANWKVLVEYPVAIPARDVLLRFNSIIQDSVAQICNLVHRNRNLRRTRELLLPRLVSGALDVAGLEIATGGAQG
jgi:type I restriction enzyme S subunit